MLKVRVIPTLLWKDFGLVKGAKFDSWRRVGSVLPAIKVYNHRDVDELVLVDISATQEGLAPDCDTVSDVADDCFVPFTVGGGICSVEHVFGLLRAGADKVTLNSHLYANQDFLPQAAARFGAQCLVASVDVKKHDDGRYECFSHSGTRATGVSVVEWVKYLAENGAGEILLTSIDRDGTMSGYDLDLLSSVVDTVNIPVIGAGGAGSYEDMRKAVVESGVSAVAAASIFHFTEQTPAEAKRYLAEAGVAVRRPFVPLVG
jgi:cyclase